MKHMAHIIGFLTMLLLVGAFQSAVRYAQAAADFSAPASAWEEGARIFRGSNRSSGEAVLLENTSGRCEADERRDPLIPAFLSGALFSFSAGLQCRCGHAPEALRPLRKLYVCRISFGRAPPACVPA